jgi:hypothetical protein
VFRLKKGDTQIEVPARLEDTMDLANHVDRIRDVLEDRIADHGVEMIVVDGNLMDW